MTLVLSKAPIHHPSTPAIWYDALSSRRQEAVIWFEESDLVGVKNDGGDIRIEINRLQISSRLGNTPRHLTFPGGSCLTVNDNDFIDAALRRLTGRVSRLHALESRWRWLATFAALAVCVIYAVTTWGVPVLAKRAAFSLSNETLAEITTIAHRQLISFDLLEKSRLPKEELQQAQNIFDRTLASIDGGDYNYRLTIHAFAPWDNSQTVAPSITVTPPSSEGIIETEEVSETNLGLANALAFPDGLIIATDALLPLLNDDEFSAVIAHEIGHVAERHGMQNFFRSAVLSGLLIFLFGDPSLLIVGGAFLLELGYSREFEQQADCFAYDYLQEQNLPATLIGDTLQKLEASIESKEPEEEAPDDTPQWKKNLIDLLSTHHSTETRKDLQTLCNA